MQHIYTAIQLKPLNKLWSYFYFDPEPHLPSLPEKTSQRKRSREVEGAEEGVKRRKEDEEQHQSKRGMAVGTFVVAPEGVCKLICHACGCTDEM